MVAGDAQGLRTFVARQLPRLRRSAFLMCGHWTLATELARDCLAKTVADLRRGAVADPDLFAYAGLMAACLRRHRRRGRVFVASAGAGSLRPESILLLDALHKVTPRCRAVLALRYFDGVDVPTAGAVLDLEDDRVTAYEQAGLAALERLLTVAETAVAR